MVNAMVTNLSDNRCPMAWTRNRRLRRVTLMACALAILALPARAHAATQTVQAKASIVKPLILTWIQDLDLGTIALSGTGTWSGAAVGITQNGAFSCGANLICAGATSVARYKVAGTNNRTVLISAPNVTLVNQADPTETLTLVTDAPASLQLTNSGPQGTNFSIGGTITLSSTTAGGTYAGTFNVTVDYQ